VPHHRKAAPLRTRKEASASTWGRFNGPTKGTAPIRSCDRCGPRWACTVKKAPVPGAKPNHGTALAPVRVQPTTRSCWTLRSPAALHPFPHVFRRSGEQDAPRREPVGMTACLPPSPGGSATGSGTMLPPPGAAAQAGPCWSFPERCCCRAGCCGPADLRESRHVVRPPGPHHADAIRQRPAIDALKGSAQDACCKTGRVPSNSSKR
jgi:hypothetical protein